MVQASTLGPNKHKRGRLRYREILNAFLKLKTFEKMTALLKNRKMVQASTLGPSKHKRGRLRYLGGSIEDELLYSHKGLFFQNN